MLFSQQTEISKSSDFSFSRWFRVMCQTIPKLSKAASSELFTLQKTSEGLGTTKTKQWIKQWKSVVCVILISFSIPYVCIRCSNIWYYHIIVVGDTQQSYHEFKWHKRNAYVQDLTPKYSIYKGFNLVNPSSNHRTF